MTEKEVNEGKTRVQSFVEILNKPAFFAFKAVKKARRGEKVQKLIVLYIKANPRPDKRAGFVEDLFV